MTAATKKVRQRTAVATGTAVDITAAHNFLRGRDLAIDMLRAGDELDSSDQSERLRQNRDGKAQNRFAREQLAALMASPQLLDGFAAVLSAKLACGDHSMADDFLLPMAEYEPGVVGADGTQPYDADPPPEAIAALADAIAGADAATADARRVRSLMDQAATVLQSAAMRNDSSKSIFALRNLAEFCEQRVNGALKTRRPDDYDEASAALASMLDLMGVLDADRAGGTLFDAAQSLLRLAKAELDAQWRALEQAEQEVAHA